METEVRRKRGQARGATIQISLKLTPYELAVIDAAAIGSSRQAIIRDGAMRLAAQINSEREKDVDQAL